MVVRVAGNKPPFSPMEYAPSRWGSTKDGTVDETTQGIEDEEKCLSSRLAKKKRKK